MIPQDKAKELLWNYLPILEGWTDNSKTDLAKKCALIAVDEILQEGMLENAPFMFNGKDLVKSNYIRYKDYWQEVKNEINKL